MSSIGDYIKKSDLCRLPDNAFQCAGLSILVMTMISFDKSKFLTTPHNTGGSTYGSPLSVKTVAVTERQRWCTCSFRDSDFTGRYSDQHSTLVFQLWNLLMIAVSPKLWDYPASLTLLLQPPTLVSRVLTFSVFNHHCRQLAITANTTSTKARFRPS